MAITTLSELTNGQEWVGLGIAGNQAEHLNQAGEADDFKDVVALENAPKGIFPWYIPQHSSFLGTNPLSLDRLEHNGENVLQPEPEIALVVQFDYADNSNTQLVEGLEVIGFSAFNDCSRRINAPKISHKKNWGQASQGMAPAILPINDFNHVGGEIDSYRLTCYLERDGQLLQYGQDTAVSDYCYFNQTLVDWIINQINTQTDHGPLEPLCTMLSTSKPRYGVIAIGATCYSAFGNSDNRFLRPDDTIHVITYDSKHHSNEAIENYLKSGTLPTNDASILALTQQVESTHMALS